MPDRHGPFRVARFLLEIDGVAKAGFSRCRLPSTSTTVVEYREGNEPPTPRKLAGLNEYGPLELRNGVTTDSIELSEWRRLVETGKVDDARRSVAVVLLDEEGSTAARWEFRNAWPASYEGPTLDADRSAVAIETLEIVHEGVRRGGGENEETDGGTRDGERASPPANGDREPLDGTPSFESSPPEKPDVRPRETE
ncbi:phage tail protein [Haloplanus pelagicus]|uniref:phage tail protein n=1 Tax=Haloplanus pelagicus TaxID=2949995 RepID=UPI00203B6D52|nr:phage tail protein [Haloplanus sp. HW8-1]